MDTGPQITNPTAGQQFAGTTSPTTSGLCAICQTPVAPSEPTTACPACKAHYHSDCWTENGGCAVYGCEQVPSTESRSALEIPLAYWGQEKKPCPVCQTPILAAAVRCRNCGTVFQTARPMDSAEFSTSAAHEAEAPSLRRRIVLIFVLSLIPFTSPVIGVIALIWFSARRDSVSRLPSLYGALLKIGIGVALFQTISIVLLAMLFTLRNH